MAERETLASRLGFILLSAGCAIGLGNVWRFPYITGQYGGAVFVLIYLVFLVIIGLPVMVMEFSIGRASGKNIAGALRKLEPEGTKWHWYGPVAIAGNYLLMMFYTTITGWLLYYFFQTVIGNTSSLDAASSAEFFASLQAEPITQFLFMAASVAIGFIICLGGLQKGVEKASKVMMLLLFAIMFVLVINSLLIPGGGEIFGSYTSKKQSLTGEAIRVIALDTSVALMAGLIIFPACFAYGVNPGSGPGLLFVTLPNIFAKMSGGRLWGALFFLFMGFAAMTTLIAVFSRKKSVWVNMILIIILSVPCILGYNVLSSFHPLGDSTQVLDLEDFLISSTIMPLGSLLFVIFCSHKCGWNWKNFIAEADEGKGVRFPSWLRVYIRWILPVIILAIFLKGYWDIFLKL